MMSLSTAVPVHTLMSAVAPHLPAVLLRVWDDPRIVAISFAVSQHSQHALQFITTPSVHIEQDAILSTLTSYDAIAGLDNPDLLTAISALAYAWANPSVAHVLSYPWLRLTANLRHDDTLPEIVFTRYGYAWRPWPNTNLTMNVLATPISNAPHSQRLQLMKDWVARDPSIIGTLAVEPSTSAHDHIARHRNTQDLVALWERLVFHNTSITIPVALTPTPIG